MAPQILPIPTIPGSGVGRSRTFSLKEAVQDAIAHLPPRPGPVVPDAIERYRIADHAAETGGLVGGQTLVVTVERARGSPRPMIRLASKPAKRRTRPPKRSGR